MVLGEIRCGQSCRNQRPVSGEEPISHARVLLEFLEDFNDLINTLAHGFLLSLLGPPAEVS